MWDLPGPGIEPVSLPQAGGFLTTGLPGKSAPSLFRFFFRRSPLPLHLVLSREAVMQSASALHHRGWIPGPK